MKRIWRIIATVLTIALTAYFMVVAAKTLDLAMLRQSFSSGHVWGALFAAAILYACIIPVTGWAWAGLLAARSEPWRPSVLAMILGLSQLAKYIPGNIAQHAARATIAVREGMKPASLISTIAQETLLAVVASVAVGLLALLVSGHGLVVLDTAHVQALVVACIVLLGSALLIFSMSKGVARKSGESAVARAISALTILPSWKVAGSALLAYAFNYLLIGAGLWFLAIALGELDKLSYLLVTAAFSLSWLLGFMTPGAPAGLGAREGIMLMLLHGASTPEKLMAFVLLARIATMMGDILCFLAAVLLHARTKRG